MLLVDTQLGLCKTDLELKKEIVAQRPVQKWIQNQVRIIRGESTLVRYSELKQRFNL